MRIGCMKKMFLTILLLAVVIFTYYWHDRAEPAITYFPPDETVTFLEAYTNLNIKSTSNLSSVTWESLSESSESLYLRQDISLLYKDGFLKGVLNKWQENKSSIILKHSFSNQSSELLQAISFHYGEIHNENQDDIKSIHTMSYDEWSHENIKTDKFLSERWSELIQYFDIDSTSYHAVPLIDLHLYENQVINGLNQEETHKVIGQLWEGLYKNYVLPILHKDDQVSKRHLMPLILFDKEANHLLVLFEWGDEKHKLLQQYWVNN